MSLRIYLLRHGETAYSQQGNFCGSLDAPLTDAGRQMAECFASAHTDIPWAGVYVSPMQRAIDTALPLCRALQLTPHRRDGLREIAYGAWEDLEPAYVQQHYTQDYLHWQAEPAWNAPTEGETAMQIAARALPVISEIEARHSDGNVLVVSHKATLRVILCSLLGIDAGRYRDRLDAPAASLSVVRFGPYGPMLERLGDRSYLPPALRDRAGT